MSDDRIKKIEEDILVLKNQLTTVSDSDVLARIEVKIIL